MSNKIPLLKGQRRRKKRWYDPADVIARDIESSSDDIAFRRLDPTVEYIHPTVSGTDGTP